MQYLLNRDYSFLHLNLVQLQLLAAAVSKQLSTARPPHPQNILVVLQHCAQLTSGVLLVKSPSFFILPLPLSNLYLQSELHIGGVSPIRDGGGIFRLTRTSAMARSMSVYTFCIFEDTSDEKNICLRRDDFLSSRIVQVRSVTVLWAPISGPVRSIDLNALSNPR